MTHNFWETKTLHELSDSEWESLCDGCGRCCLIKLEDEATNILYYTNISCFLLDINNCNCTDYLNRIEKAPGCVVLRPYNKELYEQLPSSCAYRRLSEGKSLEPWHPLITGSSESVHEADISVREKVVSEEYVHENDWQDHIIELN